MATASASRVAAWGSHEMTTARKVSTVSLDFIVTKVHKLASSLNKR